MEKFNEVFDKARKVGWEMEACYELERAAESSEGQMVLVSNNGMFDKPGYQATEGTYEVIMWTYADGDSKNHAGLTKDDAVKIFESYLA
jgi:hypothetical protein